MKAFPLSRVYARSPAGPTVEIALTDVSTQGAEVALTWKGVLGIVLQVSIYFQSTVEDTEYLNDIIVAHEIGNSVVPVQ